MNSKYKVEVNKTFEFDFTKNDVLNADIIKKTNSQYHVLHNNKPYPSEIIQSDFFTKNYTVRINANIYQISISDELDMMIKEMGFSTGGSKHVNSIKAPMPGLIIDINVQKGQSVKENDYLLVLEAMKMENLITSPRDGVIKSISASIGDAVDKGKLLIEFE